MTRFEWNENASWSPDFLLRGFSLIPFLGNFPWFSENSNLPNFKKKLVDFQPIWEDEMEVIENESTMNEWMIQLDEQWGGWTSDETMADEWSMIDGKKTVMIQSSEVCPNHCHKERDMESIPSKCRENMFAILREPLHSLLSVLRPWSRTLTSWSRTLTSW